MLIRINTPVDVAMNGLTTHLNAQVTDASETLIEALDAAGADYQAYDPKNPPPPKVDLDAIDPVAVSSAAEDAAKA